MKKHLSQSITSSSSLAAQFGRNPSQIPYLSSIPISSLNLDLNSTENLPQNSTDDEDSSEFSEEEEEEDLEDEEEEEDLETTSLWIEDADEMGQQQATSSST